MEGSYNISKNRICVILVVFAVCLLVVGLMAGLINKGCDADRDGGGGDGATTTTTPRPGTTTTQPPEDWIANPWLNPFLPNYTTPIHYNLSMYPDFYFKGDTFTGEEDLIINVTEPAKYLIVHIKFMNITQTSVKDYATGTMLDVARTFAYEPNQYWVTELQQEISGNQLVVLHLEFEGSLANGIVGYYKSTYVNADTGEESWLATTKFQPTDARKAFPGFDEPRYKTTYTVSLRHWSNFTALGNMPVETSDEVAPGWNVTTFQETVPMSTYLVCFIVCDFNFTENFIDETGLAIPHRVWSTPDKIEQTTYALGVGKVVAEFFQREFNMPFQLPKLDEVAVPDYPSGATEHWGLMTYREVYLLYDASQVAARGQISTAAVVSHEMAHNYFGNVLTNVWWEDIWLHEGFAVYYEYPAIEVAEPGWNLDEGFFAVDTQQGVMRTDASTSSRPVLVPVTTPDQINQAFDGIAYAKGASVIRMMQFFMGHSNFTAGIQKFLADNAYGVVTTDDLWRALQQELGDALDLKTVMDPWMYQMGLPVVNVTERGDGTLLLSQARFLDNPAANFSHPPSEYNYKWYIPASFETASNKNREIFWLNMTDSVITDPRGGASDWIKFNPEQACYYRVNYPPNMWQNLIDQLNADHTVFSPVDRSHLLDDAFNLARAGLLDYPTALSMTSYLATEAHFYPWHSVKGGLDYISAMLYGHPDYYLLRQYLHNITSATMDRLQVEDSGTQADKLLRSDIIRLSCRNDNLHCLQNMSSLFTDWINDLAPVAPSLRQEVYAFGFREVGTAKEWDAIWDKYTSTNVAQEKTYLLYALAQTEELWLIQRYISHCEDDTKVRQQDFFSCIGYLNSNPTGVLYAWSWVRQNYDALVDRFGTQDRYFGRMVPNMVSWFKTEFQLQEVEDFFRQYPDAGAGEAPRAQALESIRSNIAWIHRNQQDIVDWLREL